MHRRRKSAAVALFAVLIAAVGVESLLDTDDDTGAQHSAEPTPRVEVSAEDDVATRTNPSLDEPQPVENIKCDGPRSRPGDAADPQVQAEQWARELKGIAARLSASTDAEHLLVSAVLGENRDSPQSITAFQRAFEADRDHPLILWMFLDACSRHPAAAACAGGGVERRAIAVEGRNGALWARIAAQRSRRGSLESALTALQQASVAPEYDDHWGELVRLIERSFAASTSMSYTERMFAAFGTAAILSGGTAGLASTCRDMARNSTEWRYACLAFAERLEHDSGTMLFTMISLGIQSAMYEMAGNPRAKANVDRRLQEHRVLLRDYSGRQSLLEQEQDVLADYLTILEADGELAAIEFLDDEVARRKALPGYTACNPS